MNHFRVEEGWHLAEAEIRRRASGEPAVPAWSGVSEKPTSPGLPAVPGVSPVPDGRTVSGNPEASTATANRGNHENRRDLELAGVSVIRECADGNFRVLLDDVYIRVAPGEWVNVAGVNGSGKSTLVRLLAGLHCEGTTGRIERGFAGPWAAPVVLQRPEAQLFGATPREEVLLALEGRPHPAMEAERAVALALREVGLEALADTPFERLSGGQRQLAAVAAAVAGAAPLVVFDEATSRLDERSRRKVLEIARGRHVTGTAVVWVTQRLDELAPDERVVALKDGRILYDGPVRGFFGRNREASGSSPCERCGLRRPFFAAAANGMRRKENQAGVPTTEAGKEIPDDIEVTAKGKEVSAGIAATAEGKEIPADFAAPAETEEVLSAVPETDTMEGERGIAVHGLIPDGPVRLVPGTVTVIAGPNGAGKTHLLEQLAGLRPPGRLAILWNGRPLWRPGGLFGRRRLRREALLDYGFAPQDAESQLFLRTLGEEMRYSLRPYRLPSGERDRRMEKALAMFGWQASDLARDPFRMSEGEKRRAALAAALATPAPWLLLDEPTAGLDGAGQQALAAALARCKEEGRGVVVATHDWEWALPLADRLVILAEPAGPAIWCRRRDLLERPELLPDAGLEPPEWLNVAREAWKRGVPEHEVWEPRKLARHAEVLGFASDGPSPGGGPARPLQETRTKKEAAAGGKTARESPEGRKTAGNFPMNHRSGPAPFDPRALLLAYALLASGLARLGEWRELAAGAVIVAALAVTGHIPVWRWRGLIAGWTLGALLMSAAAGLAAGGTDIAAAAAQADRTLRVFTATLIAMLPGLGILTAVSPYRLKLALERLGSFRGRSPEALRWAALSAAMTLRFVPLLLAEWERFGRLSLARGKTPRLAPGAFVRALREQTVPFLLALLRLAEETAAALESRGAGRIRPGPAPVRPHWAKKDTALAAGAAWAAAALWWWTSA